MANVKNPDRRAFLKKSGAVTAAVLTGSALPARAATLADLPPMPSNPHTQAAMPTRNLGKTGYKVGVFSLGGQAALEKANNFDAAVPIIERALDLGVNYIDTSSIYGGPERWSEQYVGRVMKHRRDEAFLATKTKERTRDGSMQMIEKSLQLLNTDHVDLWQLHDIGTMTDVNQVFAKGGAMEALLEMKSRRSSAISASQATTGPTRSSNAYTAIRLTVFSWPSMLPIRTITALAKRCCRSRSRSRWGLSA